MADSRLVYMSNAMNKNTTRQAIPISIFYPLQLRWLIAILP
jgi:hypothetical protein